MGILHLKMEPVLNLGRLKVSSTVVIYLDFDRDDIDDIDVYEYLNELMENNNLDWEIGCTHVI
mgnify:CR=1 FL=1